MGDGLLQLSPEQAVGAPAGYVAYSKVCTHAGCPVGLYREASTHSSARATSPLRRPARRGPVSGPAARPLPQLPIELEADGTFVALGDFRGPVGPSFWDATLSVESAAGWAARRRMPSSWIDERTGFARWARTALRKVFPDHWSFLLGEVALFCFVVARA